MGNTNTDAIRRDLSTAIRVNVAPLSTDGWIDLVQQSGLTVENHESGLMGLLNPSRIIQEEGLGTFLTIAWNMLTQPDLRQRIFSMRETFMRHGNNLGYIVLTARKGT